MTTIFLLLLISLAINLAMFLVAYKRQSDKLTDASYAVSFVVLAAVGFYGSSQSAYHYLILALVCVWSVRIGSFLLYRVVRKGKDRRFDGTREDFFKFGRFWINQAVAVWVVMLAALLAFQNEAELSWAVWLGVGAWLIGFITESVADFQKYKFSEDPSNKGKWIEAGIWRYSRHPNYFGEILVWVGVYIIAAQSLDAIQALIVMASPLFIALLLLFGSGVPILEKSADEKWGNLPAYRKYKRQTSLIVPLPRGR